LLIWVGNILALRHCIQIEGNNGKILVDDVVRKIEQYLRKQHQETINNDPEFKSTVENVISKLPSLQVGLDVNFGFLTYAIFILASVNFWL
jgi:hypothetical protein